MIQTLLLNLPIMYSDISGQIFISENDSLQITNVSSLNTNLYAEQDGSGQFFVW